MQQAALAFCDPFPDSLSFYPEEISAMQPREKLTVAQWAEKYRMVSEGEGKGPWTNQYAHYLVEPMEAFTLPHVQSIIMCFSPQTGKTQVALNCLGYAIDYDPDPAMYILPTEHKAKDFGKANSGKISRLIQDTPRLKNLLSPHSDDTTTFMITFKNGMVFRVAWANSPSALSAESIRYLFFDETDKYGEFSGKEADPITLGNVRTTAYPYTKKKLYFSTPNTEDGVITRAMEFEADEIRDYYAVCPACGHPQRMIFDRIKWPKNIRDPRTMEREFYARYECESCLFLWSDYQRNIAVSKGFWQARMPVEKPRAIAFHLPSWYSRNTSLSEVAAAFLKGQTDLSKKMAFVTQYKAEPWKQVIKTSTQTEIFKARTELPQQVVPEAAVALTCGIDVQKYGFWFVVRAFARDYTSWLIHYGQLISWSEVEQLIFEREYPVQGNPDKRLRIWRAGVDTGGSDTDLGVSMTEATYFWLVNNVPRGIMRGINIFGTKGASTSIPGVFKVGEELAKAPSGRRLPSWFRLILVDTHKMKDSYHYHLEQATGGNPYGCYLHAETGKDYVNQILAEEKRKDRKGVEEWVRLRADNHLLDCEVIALSLAHYQFPGGGINIYAPSPPTPPLPPPQTSRDNSVVFERPDISSIRERFSGRFANR